MEIVAALGGIWRSLLGLGPQRLTILGVVGTSVFLLVAVSGYVLSRSRFEPLYVGLSQSDASRIASALEEYAVPFDVSADGTRVLVRPDNMARARALLAERGLPASASSGYELFDNLGPLGLTSFMQEVTRVRALEGEIARTVLGMQGVRSARVHIVIPESGSIRRQAQPATASVVVKFQGPASTGTVQAIRQLVSAAVPGLSVDNVRVLSTDGMVLVAGSDEQLAGPSRMAELERMVGRQVQDNIQQTLVPHLGFDNFRTSVIVRLNIDKRQVVENVFDPDSKVERSVRVVKETGNSQNAAGQLNVSVEQNVPSEQESARGQGQSQKSNQRKDEVTNFEVSSKATTTVSEGYRIEGMNVAVVLNKGRLLDSDGKQMVAEALSQRIKEIERLVSVGAGIDTRRGDQVIVSALDFSSETALGVPDDGGPLRWASGYIESALSALALIIVGLVVVWFGLRPLARSLTALPDASSVRGVLHGPAELSEPALSFSGTSASMIGAGAQARDGSADASEADGESPVDRLNVLVGHDREQALAVIRRWIREGQSDAA